MRRNRGFGRWLLAALLCLAMMGAFTPRADAMHARVEAPVGYHFDVTTVAHPHHPLRVIHPHGVAVVVLRHGRPTRLHLGVNDHRQGDTPKWADGVVAWTKHYPVRVDNEVVYRRHGYVAEVDTTVHVNGRTFYVIANAIWN